MLNLQETMETSHEQTRDRTDCSEFDPQLDFSEFLAEARLYANTKEVNQVSGTNVHTEDGKRRKRSWKTYLLSWWRSEGKKETETTKKEAAKVHCHVRRPRRGPVSGPIFGSHKEVAARLLRQASVHGSTVFSLNSKWKRSEDETPYTCLEELNNPPHLRSHGPIYLVT